MSHFNLDVVILFRKTIGLHINFCPFLNQQPLIESVALLFYQYRYVLLYNHIDLF